MSGNERYGACNDTSGIKGRNKNESEKRGTITPICGIICIVSSIIVLALQLILGEDLAEGNNILVYPLWIALGIYFCYLGRKMRNKKD